MRGKSTIKRVNLIAPKEEPNNIVVQVLYESGVIREYDAASTPTSIKAWLLKATCTRHNGDHYIFNVYTRGVEQ